MSNFRVGQKVVCIDDSRRTLVKRGGWFSRWRSWLRLDHNLNRGDVYIVTQIDRLRADCGTCIQLLHVTQAWHFEYPIGFPSCQFRPLVERKTDIKVFRRLLVPTKELARVDQ